MKRALMIGIALLVIIAIAFCVKKILASDKEEQKTPQLPLTAFHIGTSGDMIGSSSHYTLFQEGYLPGAPVFLKKSSRKAHDTEAVNATFVCPDDALVRMDLILKRYKAAQWQTFPLDDVQAQDHPVTSITARYGYKGGSTITYSAGTHQALPNDAFTALREIYHLLKELQQEGKTVAE